MSSEEYRPCQGPNFACCDPRRNDALVHCSVVTSFADVLIICTREHAPLWYKETDMPATCIACIACVDRLARSSS